MNCFCGCGERIPDKHLFRYRAPYFLRGHAPSPLCACGCETQLPYSESRRYHNSKYIRGHSRRSRAAPQACECGCGQLTTVHHGQPRRFIFGHARGGGRRGPGHYTRDGYVFIHMGNNRYRGEHRLVMERILGRSLKRHEHVHHINHNRADNRPENLQVVNWSEHGTKHGHPEGVPLSTEHRRKLS